MIINLFYLFILIFINKCYHIATWLYGRYYICTNSPVPVGKNNRYGHPNKEVLDNLENSKIYRTDQDGSIMIKIKNNKLNIETCVPQKEENMN